MLAIKIHTPSRMAAMAATTWLPGAVYPMVHAPTTETSASTMLATANQRGNS